MFLFTDKSIKRFRNCVTIKYKVLIESITSALKCTLIENTSERKLLSIRTFYESTFGLYKRYLSCFKGWSLNVEKLLARAAIAPKRKLHLHKISTVTDGREKSHEFPTKLGNFLYFII